MTRFEVHSDIAQAHTLPGPFYSDPQYLALCRERVFRRSWQLVADSEAVRVPGQCHPVTLLPGCLDEPLLLTRDKADQIHCLSNVCTHRGTVLCEHAGVEKALVCRYHGRRFDLDGTFRHMPEFERTKDFPSPADSLPRVAFGAMAGCFYFASLAPAAPLAGLLAPMMKRVGGLPLGEFRHDRSRSRDYLVRANWALYIDNYLEGFHIPFVHSSLNEAIDYGEYTTELFEGSNLQLGIAKPGEPAFDLPAGSSDAGKRVAAYYWWLFPNTMFNFYPWGLSINVVEPQGHERTRVRFLSYVWDEKKLDQGAGSGLDRVEREDEAGGEGGAGGGGGGACTRGAG